MLLKNGNIRYNHIWGWRAHEASKANTVEFQVSLKTFTQKAPVERESRSMNSSKMFLPDPNILLSGLVKEFESMPKAHLQNFIWLIVIVAIKDLAITSSAIFWKTSLMSTTLSFLVTSSRWSIIWLTPPSRRSSIPLIFPELNVGLRPFLKSCVDDSMKYLVCTYLVHRKQQRIMICTIKKTKQFYLIHLQYLYLSVYFNFNKVGPATTENSSWTISAISVSGKKGRMKKKFPFIAKWRGTLL